MTNEKSDSKSGSSGKCCSMLFIVGSALVLVVAIIVMLIPDPIHPVPYKLPDPPSLTGPLAPNEKLKSAVKMFDSIIGPESIVLHKEHMYTGTGDGKIMKISRSGEASILTMLGGNCTSLFTCGRPLGMRMDPTGKFLVVADAFLGVYKIDHETGNHKKLFPLHKDPGSHFCDDFDFLSNGDIILSDASTRFSYASLMNDLLESAGNGRLIRINMKDLSSEILREGLFFPNGVQKDLRDGGRESVLVAETWRYRITRVFVNGERRGQAEIFADNLPGMPDNIRSTEAGDGYWVALPITRVQGHVPLLDYISRWPSVRQFIAKVVPVQQFFSVIFRHPYPVMVKLDLNGHIVSSLQDPEASVITTVTQITEHAGSLYFGNFNLAGIRRLDLDCKEKKSCFFEN